MRKPQFIRKDNKKKVFFLSMTILLLLLLNVFLSFYVWLRPRYVSYEVGPRNPIPIHKKFSMIAVGDALIHDGIYKDAKTSQKGEDGYPIYDFKNMFMEIKDVIAPYDLKFYNQETIIGGKNIGLSSYPTFNSPDEIGLDLIHTGFNLVNLATNHTLDRGEKAILYSRNFWKKQDVLAVGSYDSEQDHDNVVIQEENGIKYAILGYTTVTNGLKVPLGKDYLLNVYEEEKVRADIERVRDQVDVLFVSMHWGVEYTHEPVASQKEIASYLASLGVDVIIGHHPHVIEPIEYIENTLVIYSLGNFISAQEGTMKRVGMIVAFDVEKEIKGSEKKVNITNVKADLLWTHHERYKNFKVIPFPHLTDKELKNHASIYETYKKYVSKDNRVQVGFIK